MNEELFEEIKNEILDVVRNSDANTDYKHAISTWELILRLKEDSDYALQIAALAHDIERGVYKLVIKNKFDDYDKHKAEHALRSANIIKEILEQYGLDKDFISKVYDLVKNHEIGGNFETNILRDADSISYFKDNIDYYLEKYGLEKTKFKIHFDYDRVGPDAKVIIQNLRYKNKELEKYIESLG